MVTLSASRSKAKWSRAAVTLTGYLKHRNALPIALVILSSISVVRMADAAMIRPPRDQGSPYVSSAAAPPSRRTMKGQATEDRAAFFYAGADYRAGSYRWCQVRPPAPAAKRRPQLWSRPLPALVLENWIRSASHSQRETLDLHQ